MKVRFSAVDEFLKELAQDAGIVEHDILRVSRQYQHTQTAPIMHLAVVAGALIRGQIFDTPHEEEENKKAEERAEGLIEQIKAAAARLGLDVRAGVFEA